MTVRRSSDLDGHTTAVTDHSTTVHFQTSSCDLRLSPDQAARLAGHLALAAAQVRDAADVRLARGLDRLLEAIDTPEAGVRCQVNWALPGLSCMSPSTVHVTTDDELLAVCEAHAVLVEGAA